MSKNIELTVQLHVHQVSCPGVWLCQDGFVRLTVFALGTSSQTCLLPPVFPIMFKDVLYFKKSFQEKCALDNICCLLKNETIYCELIQWTEDCVSSKYAVLAQYLGNLNDVLFPPNVCASGSGVDLLMRRSKQFPGILSPKIEITTKVRIDEVWSSVALSPTLHSCNCLPKSYYDEPVTQTKVCHTPRYHRRRCESSINNREPQPRSNSRSKSQARLSCRYDSKLSSGESLRCNSRIAPRSSSCTRTYQRGPACVYSVKTPSQNPFLENNKCKNMTSEDAIRSSANYPKSESSLVCWLHSDENPKEDSMRMFVLESNPIRNSNDSDKFCNKYKRCRYHNYRPPCDCEICKRYHQLFHKGVIYSVQAKRNCAK